MFITITNWEKYNPRSDVKHTTWFRLENTFWSDPVIYRLDSDGKMVWIGLLAVASQHMCGQFEVDLGYLASSLRVKEAKITSVLRSLKRAGKIDKHTSRPRDADVTQTLRTRASYNRQDETNESNETTRQRGRRGLRCLTWDSGHRFAKAFEHLLAIPAYAAIFDVPHDEKILEAHVERYKLTPAELIEVASRFSHWATTSGEKIRTPRGALAHFASDFAKNRQPAAAPKKSQLDELYPLITRKEDCY